ncbi:hypothetical protein [Halodesulfovibrio aestuarii]|uniref:lipopolysaccharide biosynthesis protein n=1 Tax=Halodesulfovibrio aestuarii TaxID=126333 RepID=UPI0004294DFB
MTNKLLNVFLRGTTLFSKFVLIFVLARYLKVDEVGLYGLLAATVVYGSCALGFEFYTYSTRKLLASPKKLWGEIVRDSCVFYCIAYIFLLPLLALLFEFSILPYSVCLPFYLILIFEHIGLEFNRFFVAISETLFASFLVFLKTSCWMLLVIPCIIIFPAFRHLEFVLIAWAAGALLACVFGCLKVRRIVSLKCERKVDWDWIFSGVKRAGYFYVSSMALVSLHVLDRYLIEFIGGYGVLSSYVLFSGISNSLGSFLDAGVFVFYYPKMITAYHNQDRKTFYQSLRSMSKQAVVLAVVFCAIAYLLLDFLLTWLNNPVYFENVEYCYLLLLVAVVKAVSLLPQYALYACGVDKPIVQSNVFSLFLFIVFGAVCVFDIGDIKVPVILICCYFLQFIWRWLAWGKYSRIVW